MNDHFDGNTGEVIALMGDRSTEGQSIMVQMAQAELNQSVTTARAFPRSIKLAVDRIKSLATLDAVAAQECVYALPRGGKPIRGPSVRFAEIVAAMYGNCHVGSRVVAVDRAEKVVVAEGVFHDLETGMKRVAQVQRRISDKNGKIFNDDMIAVTGNAACSVAMREAVLKGVPKAIWRSAYEAAEMINFGKAETLAVRRDKAIAAFGGFGVTPDQIFAALELGGLDDIGLEEIATLTAMFFAIKNEEATVESYFPPKATDPLSARAAARGVTKAKPAESAKIGGSAATAINAPAATDDDAEADAAKEVEAQPEQKHEELDQTQTKALIVSPKSKMIFDSLMRDVQGMAQGDGIRQLREFFAAEIAELRAEAPDLHAEFVSACEARANDIAGQ